MAIKNLLNNVVHTINWAAQLPCNQEKTTNTLKANYTFNTEKDLIDMVLSDVFDILLKKAKFKVVFEMGLTITTHPKTNKYKIDMSCPPKEEATSGNSLSKPLQR